VSDQEDVTVKHRKWFHIPLVILIFGIFGVTAWYYFSMYDKFNSKNVQDFIRGFGAWAPVAFAVIYTVSAPIPLISLVLSPLSGLLFGTLWGTVLVVGVATFSSLIPFTLSRQLGQEWVESKIKGKKLDEIYQQTAGQGGFTAILMMRLVPVLPWEVQNYVAGLMKITLPAYLIATALGIIPGSFGLVFLGEAVTDPTSWQFFAALGINGIVMIVAPLVFGTIRRRNKKKAEREAQGEPAQKESAS
jgi:uncharacterized membrane protein YdjX (TVP38/TMEM64 family)